jgi:hypothetical protein
LGRGGVCDGSAWIGLAAFMIINTHIIMIIYTFDVTGRSMRFDLQTISSSLSASNPFDLYVLTKVPQ